MRVRLYQRPQSPFWYVSYFYEGRRRRYSLGTPAEAPARLIANKIELQLALELDPAREAAKAIPLSEFLKRYIVYCRTVNAESTVIRKQKMVPVFLRDFGDVSISRITAEQVEQYRSLRLRKVKPATVNRMIAMIRHALNLAVTWGYITKNPIENIKQLREPPGRVRYLTDDEYEVLLNVCRPEIREIIITAVNTGLRRGELLALEIKDIDFGMRLLTVTRSKSGEARVLPLNDEAVAALNNAVGDRELGEVFTCSENSLQHYFAKAVREAEVEDLTFHDLRHTFASWSVMSGVDTFTVGKLMGLKTAQMVMRYAHLAPGYLADAVAQMGHKSSRIK